MKRISLWVLSTLSVVVLLLGYHTSTSSVMATGANSSVHSSKFSASAPLTSGVSGGTGGGTGTTTSGTTDTGALATPTPSSGNVARTVTGDVVQTRWGPVQVELTLSGTEVSNVSVLQYPTGNGKDEEINSYALPILTKETIAAQGSNIDMVSGATITSDGYVRSLQSALDEARR